MNGHIVISEPRRLTPAEWVKVHLLRRPDPRIEIYPVEMLPPRAPGRATGRYTVSLDPDVPHDPPSINETILGRDDAVRYRVSLDQLDDLDEPADW